MKKLKLLLLLCLLSSAAISQISQIKIVSFQVKNLLPSKVDDWTNIPAAIILTAQKAPTVQLREPKMVVQIRSNGAIICGNNNSTAQPISPFDVKTFTTAEITGMLSNCHELKEGSYQLCVQFFNLDRIAISNEVCREFRVEAAKAEDYAPPTLITPDNGKSFTEAELSRPINFRWTPLVPKPREPVTYRLKVWQLMQGQNGSQAMRSNQPIVTKDVDNITQAVVTGIYTGPCRPPYLCDFVWQVQSLNKDGKPVGRNNGNSEPYSFGVKQSQGGELKNISPEDNRNFSAADAQKPITFRWTPLVPKPQEPVTYRLKVWQLMQGQSGSQAMRSNKPIVTKDVDNLTEATVSNLWTGPCRPPYLCDYIWVVEARIKNAAGVSEPVASSSPSTITVDGDQVMEEGEKVLGKPDDPKILKIINTFPEDRKQFRPDEIKQSVTFRWTPIVPKPQEHVTYRLKVWQLMQGQNGSQAMRSNKPIVTKDVADITETTVTNLLRSGCTNGPCCPPYLCDFFWSIQVVTSDGTAGATSEPTAFGVSGEQTKGPDNVFPEDKKQINSGEALKPITFRWTPIVPKPQEPVTYRLKVWQLMQGQTGSQAMRTNKPIVTKDVDNITEATVSGIYTGPCRPPYLCDFVWMVEAITKQAGATPQVIGSSNATMFMVTQYIIQLDSIKVNCTNTPGVYSFSYTITNPNAGPATLNLFTVTSSVPAGASIGSFTPPINTVIPSGNQLTITGTINAAPNLSNICIGAEIKDVGNAFWKASKDTCVNVLPCKCEDCDEKHFTLNAPLPAQISIANNIISYNQGITVITTPPKTIKTIKADLVYFEMVPENNMCIPCNKDAATYGHFNNGTNSLQWNGPQQTLDFNITTPQLTPCCSTVFRWCIRYKIEFTDCTSCNKLVCYEKKKDGCEKINGGGIDKQNNPK